jgi:iodotyrosine deiodinase
MNHGFVPLSYDRPSPEEQHARLAEFQARLGQRRSVRHFAPDPVSRDLVLGAIAAANTAPSGANMQPGHFVLVGDPALKRRIREAAEREERQNYERRFPQEWKDALAPLGTDWHKEFLEIAPWLIAVFRLDWSLDQGGRRKKHYYVAESVGIAAGLLLAALHVAGLATLTHTPSPMNFLARILGRGPNEKPYLLIPVGYPAPGCLVPDIRKKSAEEVTTVLEGEEPPGR